MPRFSDEELRRYGRQMLLREVGGRGQERLRGARLRLRAVGEPGRVAAEYLRRAGVPIELDEADEGMSELRETGAGVPLLWTSLRGTKGELGRGCACGALSPDRAGRDSGAAAFCAGSLLALEAMKHLLGLPEALPRGRRLHLDLDPDLEGEPLVAGPAPACGCEA